MNCAEMDKALWDLANSVTAFAILQTIAFVYVLVQPQANVYLTTPFARRWIRIGTSIFAAAYCVAIWGCYVLRPPSGNDSPWLWASIGRTVAALLVCGIPFLSTLAPKDVKSR
ncbi:MAG: hypothetical protein QOF78_3820 [Phycisphaerales bacterium]|jgi:hypothetical protein|nr:hypothetical protein [Phycisphaerales bacterium]